MCKEQGPNLMTQKMEICAGKLEVLNYDVRSDRAIN